MKIPWHKYEMEDVYSCMLPFKSLKFVEVVPGDSLKSVRCFWGLKSPAGLEFLLELLNKTRASKTKVKVIFCGRY
jgi:hypothetical protein